MILELQFILKRRKYYPISPTKHKIEPFKSSRIITSYYSLSKPNGTLHGGEDGLQQQAQPRPCARMRATRPQHSVQPARRSSARTRTDGPRPMGQHGHDSKKHDPSTAWARHHSASAGTRRDLYSAWDAGPARGTSTGTTQLMSWHDAGPITPTDMAF